MVLASIREPGGATVGIVRDEAVALLTWPGSLQDLLALPEKGREVALRGVAREVPTPAAQFLAPIAEPPAFRDFYAFEKHVANARARRAAGPLPPEWYEAPAFYFSNPACIVGPDEDVPIPRATSEMDYELEIAAVIGREGRDIPAERALEHVAGLCLLNDWSMRDVQRSEAQVGLGPHKAKDFATSLGPWLVTLDELADRFDGERWDLAMTARVNGEETSRGNFRDIHFPLARLIEHASRNVTLRVGDILGSGTVGSGCLLEQPGRDYLRPGDVVELEAERLGALRNRVV